MDALNVRSALDLRQEPGACKKAAEHNVVTAMAVGPIQVHRACTASLLLAIDLHVCPVISMRTSHMLPRTSCDCRMPAPGD